MGSNVSNPCLSRDFSPSFILLTAQRSNKQTKKTVGLTSHDLGYENVDFLHVLLKSRILLPPNQYNGLEGPLLLQQNSIELVYI